MKITKPGIERRAVIEAYVTYERGKKPPSVSLSEWDWTSADAIDQRLRSLGLKPVILAGYKKWDTVELTIQDIRQCAVVCNIFRGQPRALGDIDKAALQDWTPDRPTAWYDAIARGQSLKPSEPLILRPALAAENRARWYVEDGSGRAVAFVKYSRLFSPYDALAAAYLGVVPDSDSAFMKSDMFKELLRPAHDTRVQ